MSATGEAPTIVLASASPRRQELLSRVGLAPRVVPAEVDESVLPGESADDYVVRVAADKAHAVARPAPRARSSSPRTPRWCSTASRWASRRTTPVRSRC